MTIRHIPKAPNTRLLSPEWNDAHVDNEFPASNFTFTLIDQTIAAPAVVPMEVDSIPCSQWNGFQACRSGRIIGGAVNIGNISIVAGCLLGYTIAFRLMINNNPSVYMLQFTVGDPPKKSGCFDPGLVTFNQDDIIWVQVENISPPPCTLQIRNVIGIINIVYDV